MEEIDQQRNGFNEGDQSKRGDDTMRHVQGVIHGKTIELDHDLGMAEGQRVDVEIRVSSPARVWGEGILRSAGIAADVSGFDEIFEQVQRDRELATSRDIDE